MFSCHNKEKKRGNNKKNSKKIIKPLKNKFWYFQTFQAHNHITLRRLTDRQNKLWSRSGFKKRLKSQKLKWKNNISKNKVLVTENTKILLWGRLITNIGPYYQYTIADNQPVVCTTYFCRSKCNVLGKGIPSSLTIKYI